MFKGTDDIFKLSTSEELDINLKYWLDWSFLNIGAFQNVYLNTSGSYGGDQSRLIPIKDYRYADGQVWRTFHPNLVWESGLSYSTQPISISGVYINGTLTPASIDYPNGRIILNTATSPSSVLKMEYSYKLINVYSASECDWLGDLQNDTFRIDRQNYTQNSGEYHYNRPQLPAVVYQIAGRSSKPYMLGLGQWSKNLIHFDILDNNRAWTQKIADILSEQKAKVIYTFDAQLLSDSGGYPLSASGTLKNNAKTYDQLVIPKEDNGYRSNKLYITESKQGDPQKLKQNLYYNTVKMEGEIILTDI